MCTYIFSGFVCLLVTFIMLPLSHSHDRTIGILKHVRFLKVMQISNWVKTRELKSLELLSFSPWKLAMAHKAACLGRICRRDLCVDIRIRKEQWRGRMREYLWYGSSTYETKNCSQYMRNWAPSYYNIFISFLLEEITIS